MNNIISCIIANNWMASWDDNKSKVINGQMMSDMESKGAERIK